MKYLFVMILLFFAASLFAQEGPRTPRKDFFLHHLDLSIPELAPIRELAENDKIAEAEHVFAEYVRKHADGETVNMKGRHEPYFQGWLPGSYARQNHREVNTPTRTGSFEGSRRVVTVLYPSRGEYPIASVTASGDTRSRNLVLNMKDGRELEIKE